MQAAAAPAFSAQQEQCSAGRLHQGRGKGGGVDQRAGPLNQSLHQPGGARDEGAGTPQRLAEGAHQNGDLFLAQAQVLQRARSGRAQDADPVGIVHHQRDAAAAAEPRDLAQRRNIALHAEYALGDRQAVAAGGGGQFAPQRFRVRVTVP